MTKKLIALLVGITLAGCERERAPQVTPAATAGSADWAQEQINAAAPGGTVTMPDGEFTWDHGITISKAVKFQGGGGGRIIGKTKTSMSVGTGSKTFTTTKALGMAVGEPILVAKFPNRYNKPAAARENFMQGTVTAINGTSVTMNVTSTGGSGTWVFWWVARPAKTTINNVYNNGAGNDNGATPLIKVNLGNAPIEISGIRIVNKPTGQSSCIGVNGSQWIQPKLLIHDCWFQLGETDRAGIFSNTNQVLAWNCSFDSWRWSSNIEGIQVVNNYTSSPSWQSDSTFGMKDTNGATNFYVEDCDFHSLLTARDPDSNSRFVERYCIFDNSSGGPHGADTSTIGNRHGESYNNELQFDAFGSDCTPEQDVQWFIWLRGGSWVVTDNILPKISSSCSGTKPNIKMSVLNIQRKSGPYCCWKTYPAPHQVGQGWGNGAVFHSYVAQTCYAGQRFDWYEFSEPTYIWNNTGTAGNETSLYNDSDECGNGLDVSTFIQEGRDFIKSAKPGYQKFTYPHPLRGGAPQPTQTPNATPTPAASPSPTQTPAPSPVPTASPSPTRTPSPTATATATATPTATVVPSPTATVGPSASPSATVATPTPLPSESPAVIILQPGHSVLITVPNPTP